MHPHEYPYVHRQCSTIFGYLCKFISTYVLLIYLEYAIAYCLCIRLVQSYQVNLLGQFKCVNGITRIGIWPSKRENLDTKTKQNTKNVLDKTEQHKELSFEIYQQCVG